MGLKTTNGKKLVVFFLLAIVACAFKNDICKHQFVIRIWDRDFSMGYSVFYQIDGDSIIVKYKTGGEAEKILMRQGVMENQCEEVWKWLSARNIDSFSTAYIDRRIQDGDQKIVEFVVGNKTKTIAISNYYLRDMGELFDIINHIVRKDLQIKYNHSSFSP